jgi:two-component system, chemotaxis family, CheB/CheR fusion protein
MKKTSESFPASSSRKWLAVGPVFGGASVWVRYSIAFGVVMLVALSRGALTPLLGNQSPLLPFVFAVFVSTHLAGRGPGLFASLFTPFCATVWFATLADETAIGQWSAHVTFFLLLSLAITFLIDALQRNYAARVSALDAATREVAFRQRAEKALRDSHRQKDEFLAMLAHELRNPLAPIRNVAHMLSRDISDSDRIRRAGEVLNRQANQLARLVDDLLDVSRITRGVINLMREPVSLETAVKTAVETVEPQTARKNQVVVVEPISARLVVHADAVRLSQIFVNLLSNASKYSPEGAQIRVAFDFSSDRASVTVRDKGQGIDAQLLPHVFELFRQGDRSLDRTDGGLGIGLTIAKHLVEMHGGQISAKSSGPGQGSEFRVDLPRTQSPVLVEARETPSPESRSTSLKILVAEDNTDSASTMASLLGSANHVVAVVHSGPAALSAIKSFDPQVALLDIGLPGMDGYMLASEIRKRMRDRAPRLIALTGYATEEDRALALQAGFDLHLAKPVDPARLLELLDNYAEESLTKQKKLRTSRQKTRKAV